MVTWTRLNITFYLHWLSCLFSKWFGLPVRPNQPTTHLVNGPLYPEKMWSACDGDHTHTDGALKLRTIWTLLLLLLLQSALQPLLVLTCSTIVEYSQQEGFYRVPLPAARQSPILEDQWLERYNSGHQVSPRLKRSDRTPAAEGGTMGEKGPRILPKVGTSTSLLGSFTCRKFTKWDRRLYFPSEGRRAEDFFAP